ncbi:hypothetical protein [uncultured Paraglaciecola sp.]|uniref:hypothetical protein n=1 Tax=uncultured Paraglaciecola sp. TaxID=1765024 RepID=UPI00262C7998|nr:hypothetical protein [uncultured Paraglaciecola sp.]
MQIFDFPTFTAEFMPSNSDAFIVANSEMNISKINGSQRISENPGEGWEVNYKFGVMHPSQARAVKGLLQKLRGHKNAVRLLDTNYSHIGAWASGLTVDGANQYGLSINIKNAPPNTTIAYATDRFKLTQVHELTEDAVTNASGKCTLKLANEVREPTTVNQPIITALNQLFMTCRWADPMQIKQFKGRARLYRNITLDFLEQR